MDAEPVVTQRRRSWNGLRPAPRVARAVGIAAAAALLTSACAAGQLAQTSDQKASIDGTNVSVGDIDLRGLAIQAPPSLQRNYPKGSDAALNLVIVNNGRSKDRLVGIAAATASGWAAFGSANDAYLVQQASFGSATPTPSESAAPSGSTTPTDSASPTDSTSPTGSESSSGSTAATGTPSRTEGSSSAPALPTGTQSVTLPAGERVSYGTPDATGGLLITGLSAPLYPGNTLKLKFTFADAGSITVFVPVQLADIARTAKVEGGEGE